MASKLNYTASSVFSGLGGKVFNSSKGYDIVAGNTAIATNVAEELREYASKIQGIIDELYALIDSFYTDEAWMGVAYETFKSNCETYREPLSGYVAMIESFANICDGEVVSDISRLDSVITLSFILAAK